MKICFWFRSPSPHQVDFLNAMRRSGTPTAVMYLAQLSEKRRKMGWGVDSVLRDDERWVDNGVVTDEMLDEFEDYVHIVTGYAHPTLRFLSKRLTERQIAWVHLSESATPGLRWWLTYPRKRAYAARVNRGALGAFGYGSMTAKDLRKWGIDRAKIGSTWYAVNALPVTSTDKKSGPEGPRFLYVGSLYDGKGIDVLIEAFASVRKQFDTPRLTLVGDDRSDGRYATAIQQHGLGNAVEFVGTVPRTEITPYYDNADVLVLPSRYDGWGAVLNEGASAGLPLIGSMAAGASHHLIRHEQNGFQVTPGSVDSLNAAMTAYCSDPELIQTHSRASLQIFDDFTPEVCAKSFLNQIDEWAARKTAA